MKEPRNNNNKKRFLLFGTMVIDKQHLNLTLMMGMLPLVFYYQMDSLEVVPIIMIEPLVMMMMVVVVAVVDDQKSLLMSYQILDK